MCVIHITKSILRKTTRAQKILMGLDLGLRFGVYLVLLVFVYLSFI